MATDYYAQLFGTFAGDIPWSFGWHINSTESETGLLATWVAAMTDTWTNGTYGIETLFPSTTTTTLATVATLNSNQHELSKSRSTLAIVGTGTGTQLPFDNAEVLSLRQTGIRRGQRGRTYLPAMLDTVLTAGFVNSTAGDRIRDAFRAAQSSIISAGGNLYTFNRKPWKDGTPAFTKQALTIIDVSNKVGVRRHRLNHTPAQYYT